MYFLRNLVLVNWHNFDPIELPFADFTAIVGENRSGKSTLLDALQVAMIGNHGQWRDLNRAAAEERSARTVRSYCLGTLSPDAPPLRESAVTWLALHFRDSDTNHDVSLALHIIASLDDPHERTSWLVFKGLRVHLSDLVEEFTENGEQVVEPLDWETAMLGLERRVAATAHAEVLTPGGSEKYVGEWMKAMRVGGRSPRPHTFGRAFVNAVAYRQVASDDQFFKRFMLPQKPINIEQLRTAIATYREVHERIQAIRRELRLLREAEREAAAHAQALATADTEAWIAARAEAQHGYRLMRRNQVKARDRAREADQAEREFARAKREHAEAEAERSNLESRINQTTSGQLRNIELEETNRKRERDEASRALATWYRECREAARSAQDGLLTGTARLDQLATGLRELGAAIGPEPARFPENPGRVLAALRALDDLEHGANHLENIAGAAHARKAEADRAYNDAQSKLDRLRSGQAPIDEETSRFLEALEGQGLTPQILCSLVRVSDEQWRDAAEALLGRDREAIILPPDQVETAIRFWRRQGARFRRCRVARTDKVAPVREAGTPRTMDGIVVSDHPLVTGYLRRRIGGVRLADTVEAMKAPGRAIMRDAMYDDGLSVRRLAVPDVPLLGKEVGAAAEAWLVGEMERLAGVIRDERGEARRHDQSAEALRALAAALGDGRDDVESLAGRRASAEERLEELQAQRRKVEASIAPEWQTDLEALRKRVSALQETRDEASAKAQKARIEEQTARDELGKGEDAPGSLAFFRMRLYRLKQAERRVPKVASGEIPARRDIRKTFRTRLGRKKDEPKVVAHEAEQARSRARDIAESRAIDFWNRMAEYRSQVATPQAERLKQGAVSVAEAAAWVRERIDRQENHALVEHREQMERASEEMSKAFQTAFVAEVRDRMEIVRNSVDGINRILQPHVFHEEHYRFNYRVSDAYTGIIDLANLAADDPNRLIRLFDDSEEEGDRYSPAVESVKQLLLSDDLDARQFEDYRNYWVFWLESKPRERGAWVSFQRRKGTNSGAESQTPFYIAMAAALSAAYKGGRTAPSYGGMGLALFDEAFSKMDARNQRRMLDFFASIGLQPVVAAPLSDQSAMISRMSQIHEVWRKGSRADVESYVPGEELKKAIENADPANLTREQLTEMARGRGLAAQAGDARSDTDEPVRGAAE